MCEYTSFEERTRLKKSFESLMQYPETKVVWIKTKPKDGHFYIEGIYRVKPSESVILHSGEPCSLYKVKLFKRGTQINISEKKAILDREGSSPYGEIVVTTKDPFVFTRFSALILSAHHFNSVDMLIDIY